MRLGVKLILGYAFLVLLLLALGLLAVEVSQRSLKREISEQSLLQVSRLMAEIERNLYDRLEESRLFARSRWLCEALIASNEKFAGMPDPEAYIDGVEAAWLQGAAGGFPAELLELAENPAGEAFRERIQFYRETYGYPVIGEIFVTNRYGANVAQSGWTSDYRQNDEPWWHAAKENQSYFGDVTYDESARIYSMEVAVRVDGDRREFLGVMKIVFNVEEVIDLIRLAEAVEDVYSETNYELLTRGGGVVYSTRGYGVLSDRSEIVSPVPSTPSHSVVFERTDDEGKRFLSAQVRSKGFRDFRGLGWVLVMERPTDEVLAPVRDLRNRLWQFGAITVALAVAMGGLVSASIERRLLRLRRGMDIIASGNLGHKVATPHRDEIGDLSREFDRMTSRLQETTVSRDNLAEEVAERRKAEARLQEALAELERSNRELEQFAYVASHDLQEPLRKIRGFTDLLGRRYKGRFDEKADRHIGYIVDGAVRMERLIKDLLAYSRAGRGEFETEPTDMGQVVQATLQDLERAVTESGAAVDVGPMPMVRANGRQMRLVFQNLVLNAIKFRREMPPRINIAAEKRGDEWVFSVRDNGMGMNPAYFDRIFQVFQRLHTREEYPGTGIGLAICKKIIERHGGRIWVESKEGEGSCFFFAVPAGPGLREKS